MDRDFPPSTIRDNVQAVHKLLTDELHITHLEAVVGFSMGAQQAFQWAVSYPDFEDRVVATSGTAKTYGHGIVRLEGQIAALTADEAFQGGDYKTPPQKGLSAFGMVWAAWLYSQEWWRKELWRTNSPPGTTFESVMERFRTRFIPGADANDLICQMRTWEHHDVGATPGFGGRRGEGAAVDQSAVPLHAFGNRPVFSARRCSIRSSLHSAWLSRADPSLWGHPAGAAASPEDGRFLNEKIGRFLAEGHP